jgi:hypothetical protein
MIPFKINQTVKTHDGRIGRILFYTDYKVSNEDYEPSPTSAVVLFVNKWSEKYPFSKLMPISRDEYDEAVKADKKAVEDIFQHLVVTERAA